MRRDRFDEHVARGRANLEAIELLRAHCRHGRAEFVGGNSPVGDALGLPMGMLQIRCAHAPLPPTSGFDALELAVEFYRTSCIECPYSPSEIAEAYLYLMRGTYTTGQVLRVDGGYTLI